MKFVLCREWHRRRAPTPRLLADTPKWQVLVLSSLFRDRVLPSALAGVNVLCRECWGVSAEDASDVGFLTCFFTHLCRLGGRTVLVVLGSVMLLLDCQTLLWNYIFVLMLPFGLFLLYYYYFFCLE